ncbi:unnamed protein product, partial [Ectocarpus sp. 13 AM-2016]
SDQSCPPCARSSRQQAAAETVERNVRANGPEKRARKRRGNRLSGTRTGVAKPPYMQSESGGRSYPMRFDYQGQPAAPQTNRTTLIANSHTRVWVEKCSTA